MHEKMRRSPTLLAAVLFPIVLGAALTAGAAQEERAAQPKPVVEVYKSPT